MKSIITGTAIAALFAVSEVSAATDKYKYGYIANGADWPLIKEEGTECHANCQSPIDLRTEGNTAPHQMGNGREFNGKYKNLENVEVTNLGKTIQVNIPKADQEYNFFESGYSKDELGGDLKFTSLQFHFHAKSEHTINGKRYDLEMHTVHAPDEAKGSDITIKYSALGLMFDVDDYDMSITPAQKKTIDSFFDSLTFDKVPPTGGSKDHKLTTSTNIPFGDLMNIVNFASRWVYTGSLTTPPCTVGVYFQVVDRVLPISKKHYQLYLAQQREYLQDVIMEKDGAGYKETAVSPAVSLDLTGNWRVTQQINDHNVTYMRINYPVSQKGRHETVTVIVAVLLVLALLLSIVLAFCAFRFKKQIKEKEGVLMAEGGNADHAFQGNRAHAKIEPINSERESQN